MKRLLLLGVVIMAFVYLGCGKDDVVIITEPVDRAGDIIADRGCCTTGDSCASGVGVDKEYCAETNGTFHKGKKCADVGNACE